MLELISRIPAALSTAVVLGGLGYYAAALYAARRQQRINERTLPGFAPGVTVLKSLKGLDPGMLDAFRSHCRQQYDGPFELLFGVQSLDDPAVAAVRQLEREFPDHAIRLVHCPEVLGTNGKISTLVQLAREARHDVWIINDSDITVSPTYLDGVVSCFALRGAKPVGMVTALYRGRAHGTWFSDFESLGISCDFQAGVLLSKMLEKGLHYGLGSTLAVRREAVERIGGLEVLVDQLADDYELGARIDRAGYRIELSPEVVETSVPAYDWTGFRDHQIRWLRTVRDARPGGYFGLLFTHGFAVAALNVLLSGFAGWSIALLAAAWTLRSLVALLVGMIILEDDQVLPRLGLLAVRDLIAFALWLAGFAGHTIVWRGRRFRLQRGRLYDIAAR